MKILLLILTLAFCRMAMSQSLPNDQYLVGQGSSAGDKGFVFNTGDGANNKKLVIEKISKMLKFDGNVFQLGDGALTEDKKIIFNGTSGAYLMYDHTNTELSTNDDFAIDAGKSLKTNSINTKSGTVVSLEQDTRSKGKMFFGTSGNVQIRENAGNLEFSLDGSLYKKVGSGSGGGDGGAPIQINGSFEDGVTSGWSNSGGTKTQGTYTNGPEGDTKYLSFVASSTGQYFESTAVASSDFMVGGCLAKLDYYSTDASGTFKLQVYDGASNLLKETSLDPKNWQPGYASFNCPTIGTTVKMRVISTAAGTILADRTYLGKENRTFQVAQAKLAGESYFKGTGSCIWTRSSAGLGQFSTVSACPGPTVTSSSMGTWGTTDTDLPIQTVSNLPAGTYRAMFKVPAYAGATNRSYLSISDGSTSCEPIQVNQTTAIQDQEVYCTFEYATSGTRSFQLISAASSSSINVANDQTIASSKFSLDYWPNSSQTALVPEAQDWFIDANIGATASVSLGTSTISSYSQIPDGSMDLVLNPGSSLAYIACNTAVVPTGSTCSGGNESLGVQVNIPQAGFYKACMEFSHYISTSTGGNAQVAFELNETDLLSPTILQEGKSRIDSAITSASTAASNPLNLCGTFYFASAGPRALRLMYEQNMSGTVSNNLISIDRTGAIGQRDLHFTMWPMLSGYNRPYLLPSEKLTAITSNYTALTTDSTISHSGSAATLTIPSSITNTGKIYKIRSIGGNALTVQFTGGESVDGSTTFTVGGGTTVADSVEIQSTGSGWIFLNNSGIREDSCRINNNGTATLSTSSGQCDKWINTVTRSGLGSVTIVFLTRYSTDPICEMTPMDAVATAGARLGNFTTAGGVANVMVNSTTAIDSAFNITCKGKR